MAVSYHCLLSPETVAIGVCCIFFLSYMLAVRFVPRQLNQPHLPQQCTIIKDIFRGQQRGVFLLWVPSKQTYTYSLRISSSPAPASRVVSQRFDHFVSQYAPVMTKFVSVADRQTCEGKETVCCMVWLKYFCHLKWSSFLLRAATALLVSNGSEYRRVVIHHPLAFVCVRFSHV